MEIFVQIVFILALLKFCLKAASTSRFWILALYSLGAAVFALIIYPFVITQPVNIISELLASHQVVTDGAVLTTMEAILGIFISILLLDNYFMPRDKRKKSLKVLKLIPGILVFFAIAYFELLFFKMNVGVDFMVSAIIYALILFISITLIALFMKTQMKQESVKLELKIILNIGILIIGLLINSSVADYNLSNAQTVIEWKPLLTFLLIAAILFSIGIISPKINFKSLLKIK